MTNSIKEAISETNRRRAIQIEHNKIHNITPKTIVKSLKDSFYQLNDSNLLDENNIKSETDMIKEIKLLKTEMFKQASELNFEVAAKLRDQIEKLEHFLEKK
jgi:excinuclease ABC subunit B